MTDGRQAGIRRRIADDLEDVLDRHHDALDEWEIDAIQAAVAELRRDRAVERPSAGER